MKNYFAKSETMCICGCGRDITPEMLAVANRVREEWGGPITCTSGARCEAYNQNLRDRGYKAAMKSAHLGGIAVDLKPGRGNIEAFHEFCMERLEKWGVRMEAPGVTPSWCHLDMRAVPPGHSHIFKP